MPTPKHGESVESPRSLALPLPSPRDSPGSPGATRGDTSTLGHEEEEEDTRTRTRVEDATATPTSTPTSLSGQSATTLRPCAAKLGRSDPGMARVCFPPVLLLDY